MANKSVKICCSVVTALFTALVIVAVFLGFTRYRLRDPVITVQPEGLNNAMLEFLQGNTNITIGMNVTVNNPNYGSFRYKNSTSYVHYHGDVVAELPLQEAFVPDHGLINFTTQGNFMLSEVMNNPNFGDDLIAGGFNLTAKAKLPGTLRLFNRVPLPAKAYTTCQIYLNIRSLDVQSNCKTKIKL